MSRMINGYLVGEWAFVARRAEKHFGKQPYGEDSGRVGPSALSRIASAFV
jgi:hypothetical protein